MDIVGHEEFQLDIDEDPPRFNHILDPQTTWAPEPFELFRCCLLRTLMSYNGRSVREGGAELQPDLADGYPEISSDGLAWTFHLKPGLHYAPPMADKTIVSGDFIRALQRALRPDPFAPEGQEQSFGPYANYFSEVIAGAEDFTAGRVDSISGLESPNDTTLVIHLLRPAGDLGARLAMPAAAPIPPGVTDGHDAGYGRYLVSSGPYMIEGSEQLDPSLPPDQQPTVPGYVPGEHLFLVRNPSWNASTDSLRSAIVDRIEITQINDYDAELAAIQSDELDISFLTDLSVQDVDRLRGATAGGPAVYVSPRLASDWITMNLAVPPFDDVHVRRAVNLATNRKALVQLIWPDSVVQNHAIPDAFENGLLTDYNPFATPDNAGSLDRARSELALSRYDTDHDGQCDDAACAGIQIPVRNDQPEYAVASQAFAAQMAPLGLVVEPQSVDPGEAFGQLNDPASKVPMSFTIGWQSDYLNASAWFGPLASGDAIGQDYGANLSLVGATSDQLTSWGYGVSGVPGLEQKIDSCVSMTGAAQFQCWAAADQYLMERVVPWVPLDNRQAARLTSPSVTSFEFDASLTLPALDQITVRVDE